MFWKFIQYTLHWDKTKMLKKIPFGKKTLQKMHSCFFRELQLIRVLLLICNSYMSWSARSISLKGWVGFFIFVSFSFLLKFIFVLNKKHIQKQPSRGVLRKRCSKNMQKFTGEHPCQSVISIELLCKFLEKQNY